MCKLRSDSCTQQVFIDMAYEGQCDKCKSVTCPNYGICIDDGYTYKTADGKRSAHFEHTIVITNKEPEILTKI